MPLPGRALAWRCGDDGCHQMIARAGWLEEWTPTFTKAKPLWAREPAMVTGTTLVGHRCWACLAIGIETSGGSRFTAAIRYACRPTTRAQTTDTTHRDQTGNAH